MPATAEQFGHSALIARGASDKDIEFLGNQDGDFAGAGFDTGSATGAFLMVHAAHAIFIDGDGSEGTGSQAIVETHAAPAAGIGSIRNIDSGLTTLDAVIAVFPVGVFVASAGTMEYRYFLLGGSQFFSHNGSDFGHGVYAARGTEIDISVGVNDCVGIATATGHATGAAIGTRQDGNDLLDSGVQRDGKELGGNSQTDSENQTQSSDDNDWDVNGGSFDGENNHW